MRSLSFTPPLLRAGLLAGVLIGLGASATRSAPVPEAIARHQEITRALEQLTDPSATVREQALRLLIEADSDTLPALEQALDRADLARKRALQAALDRIIARQQASADVHVVGAYTSGGRRAVVRVGNTPHPIVLVLCAYDPVSWEIEAEPGARIVRVIVSGYHIQQVSGAAPSRSLVVTYEGSPPGKRDGWFYAYKAEGKSYQKTAEHIRQLTGREVTSFQGSYDYPQAPVQVGVRTAPGAD